jgi:hypothetical protein
MLGSMGWLIMALMLVLVGSRAWAQFDPGSLTSGSLLL